MLGLGSLTLPSVFARLGWIPALIVVIVCGFGTMYSGRLFALLATKVRSPQSCLVKPLSTFVENSLWGSMAGSCLHQSLIGQTV